MSCVFDLLLVYICDSLIYIKRAYVFDTMSLVRGRKLCQGSRLDSPKDQLPPTINFAKLFMTNSIILIIMCAFGFILSIKFASSTKEDTTSQKRWKSVSGIGIIIACGFIGLSVASLFSQLSSITSRISQNIATWMLQLLHDS